MSTQRVALIRTEPGHGGELVPLVGGLPPLIRAFRMLNRLGLTSLVGSDTPGHLEIVKNWVGRWQGPSARRLVFDVVRDPSFHAQWRLWSVQHPDLLVWWADWVCDEVTLARLLTRPLTPKNPLMAPAANGKASGIVLASMAWWAERRTMVFNGEGQFLERLEQDCQQGQVLPEGAERKSEKTEGYRENLGKGNLQKNEQVGPGSWCLRIDSPQAAQLAETWLVRQLVKSTDGFFARHVDRKVSLAFTRMIAATPLTPNAMSWITILIGLLGGRYLAWPGPQMKVLGAGLFLASSIVDGCDGELARLRLEESRWGGWLDLWGDNLVHLAVFLGLGLGLAHDFQQSRWLVLSGLASFGTLCAVSIVSWRTARQKRVVEGAGNGGLQESGGPLFTSVAGGDRPHELSPWRQRLIAVSNALARRDFVYGVFVLALIEKLGWFLWASAIGANLYALTLLLVNTRGRR